MDQNRGAQAFDFGGVGFGNREVEFVRPDRGGFPTIVAGQGDIADAGAQAVDGDSPYRGDDRCGLDTHRIGQAVDGDAGVLQIVFSRPFAGRARGPAVAGPSPPGSLRGLFERAPVAAVELRPEANDLRPAPTQLVTSLRTKFLRLIYPTINYRPIAATDTPQGV